MKNYIWILIIGVAAISLLASAASKRPDDGFFRVEEKNGKWFLVDPGGQPFFMRGLNHYGDGSHMPWNRDETYDDRAAWRRSLRDRSLEWGFNYLGPSIGPSAVDPSSLTEAERKKNRLHPSRGLVTRTPPWPVDHFTELDMPFTVFFGYPKQYMGGPGMPDVFSDDFAKEVDRLCSDTCSRLKGDPNLIGYYLTHNPPWHPRARSFNQWIEDATRPGSAGLKEWVKLMRRIYGSLDRWRETYGVPVGSWDEIETLEQPLRGYVSQSRMLEDSEAFIRRICDRWYQVYSESIRRYDPNHLILGDRNTLHLQPLPGYAIETMKRYIDVLSVNVMGPPASSYPVLEQATRHWDGPILLADTGAGVYEQGVRRSGYQVRDLHEFESVYSGILKMGVNHPQVIGFGWCGFYETPPPGARSGLVDCRTGEGLRERIAVAQEWNQWIERQPGFSRND